MKATVETKNNAAVVATETENKESKKTTKSSTKKKVTKEEEKEESPSILVKGLKIAAGIAATGLLVVGAVILFSHNSESKEEETIESNDSMVNA